MRLESKTREAILSTQRHGHLSCVAGRQLMICPSPQQCGRSCPSAVHCKCHILIPNEPPSSRLVQPSSTFLPVFLHTVVVDSATDIWMKPPSPKLYSYGLYLKAAWLYLSGRVVGYHANTCTVLFMIIAPCSRLLRDCDPHSHHRLIWDRELFVYYPLTLRLRANTTYLYFLYKPTTSFRAKPNSDKHSEDILQPI
jgi:hypothetical protein